MALTAPYNQGVIIPIDGGGGVIRFQYNPDTVNGPSAQAKWAQIEVSGREFPYLQYSNGNVSQIRFDLIFATRDDSGASVKSRWQSLNSLTIPSSRGGGLSRPPIVMLILGTFLRERCVVAEITPYFRIGRGPNFADSLLPDQARIGITLWRIR